MHLYVSATNIQKNPITRQLIKKLREFGYTIIATGEAEHWEQAIEDSTVFLLIWQGEGFASREEWELALQSQRRIVIIALGKLDDLPDELKSIEVFEWSMPDYAGEE